jgi:hemerythrin-like domain-containing protein
METHMASREPTNKVDAIYLLEKDHQAVQGLFAEFKKFEEDGTEDADELKQAIMDDVCSMLKVHSQIEDEIFYPAARAVLPDDEDLMEDVESEQKAAEKMVAEIEKGSATDVDTCALFLELSDAIDEHIIEEQDELFPKVQEAGMDTAEVGARMKARKEELESQAPTSVPDGSPTQNLMDRITAFWGPPSI